MNSIIGTLEKSTTKSKQNKIKTELTFVVVLVFMSDRQERLSFLVKSCHVKIWRVRRRIFHKLQNQIFLLFQFSKNRQ